MLNKKAQIVARVKWRNFEDIGSPDWLAADVVIREPVSLWTSLFHQGIYREFECKRVGARSDLLQTL